MAIYQNKDKKTKDGRSWYFRTYYTDIYGNRKQKESIKFFTKKEAVDAEIKFLSSVKTNNEIDYNVKFSAICDEWLSFKRNTVRESTYYGIEKKVYKHILPFFNKFNLHSIKLNSLIEYKKYLENKTLTLDYKNTIIGILQEILSYAVNNYDFDIKVASKLQKNKVHEVKKRIKESEINFWTLDEFKKFIAVVDDEFYFTLFNFLYYTGLRYGEMSALTWKDIDFERKELIINKSLTTKIKDGGYAITPPKTNNSNRIIDLDDNLITILKKHYEKESKIYNFDKSMFIFGNVRFLAQTTFRNNLKKYVKKANVKYISPHGFRHCHASLLIYLGCDSRDVAERLGDTTDVIETTYYHMFPKKKKHTLDMLNSLN